MKHSNYNLTASFAVAVSPTERMKGYAFEIEKSILYVLFTQAKVDVVFHKCLEENIGSHRIAEKLGFIFKRIDTDDDETEYIYELDSQMYLKTN